MGIIVDFLIDNYIYVVFTIILLILALIGYIVDSSKAKKHENILKKSESQKTTIPETKMDSSIKLGETVNQTTTNSNPNVNAEISPKPLNTLDDVLK